MDLERRLIPLEGGSNFRDIGGYVTADGRTTRWNTVYRSGALYKLTQADWQVVGARGVVAVCDLRSSEERELAPTIWGAGNDVNPLGAPYDAERLLRNANKVKHDAGVGEMEEAFYELFADLLAPSYGAMFSALAQGRTPLIVHCTAGQDRTGLAIGLLLTVLGVPLETILVDYALSTELRRPQNELNHQAMVESEDRNAMAKFFLDAVRARGADAFKPRKLVNAQGQPMLAESLGVIQGRWGSVEGYLDQAAGISPADLDRVRANLLD